MDTIQSTITPEMQAAWQALAKQLTLSLTLIWKIDHGNLAGYDRSAFVGSISRKVERLAANGDATMVEKALELVKAYNWSQPIPAIPEGHRFWSFAELARNEMARAKTALKLGPEIIVKADHVQIVADSAADSVIIKFAAKPRAEIIAKLHAESWIWSGVTFDWRRKLTEAAKDSARRIVGIL